MFSTKYSIPDIANLGNTDNNDWVVFECEKPTGFAARAFQQSVAFVGFDKNDDRPTRTLGYDEFLMPKQEKFHCAKIECFSWDVFEQFKHLAKLQSHSAFLQYMRREGKLGKHEFFRIFLYYEFITVFDPTQFVNDNLFLMKFLSVEYRTYKYKYFSKNFANALYPESSGLMHPLNATIGIQPTCKKFLIQGLGAKKGFR